MVLSKKLGIFKFFLNGIFGASKKRFFNFFAKSLKKSLADNNILFVGIHRSHPDKKLAHVFFMTSYWQQSHFFMVPVADSKMFRFLESCSGVLFQWIELVHEVQELVSALSTLVCDSISGFEGLAAGNCCVCVTFDWIRAVKDQRSRSISFS